MDHVERIRGHGDRFAGQGDDGRNGRSQAIHVTVYFRRMAQQGVIDREAFEHVAPVGIDAQIDAVRFDGVQVWYKILRLDAGREESVAPDRIVQIDFGRVFRLIANPQIRHRSPFLH